MPDISLMERALSLAENGRPFASPNPLVGCVIVNGGRVVGEGWHAAFGGPHAEVAALRRAGRRAKGGTLYVTLEPCSHWGKTGPCAEAVARAGIRRVVAAVKDPNPAVSGRGLAYLRQRGIGTQVGLLAREAAALNRAFFKRQKTGLPWVVWKAAQTLDGKIASRTGASRWITGPEARELGHRLRAQSDAILVGGETVRRDDPWLTSHGKGPDPLRIVVSRRLDLPLKAKVFQAGGPTWVVSGPGAPSAKVRNLEKRGIETLKFSLKDDAINFREIMMFLGKININQVLFEGGGTTAWGLLSAGLVDEAYFFQAPMFLGGRDARTSLEGAGWPTPQGLPRLTGVTMAPVGEDILVHGFLRKAS